MIDLFGYSEEMVRKEFPRLYQYLVEHVKPERSKERNLRLRKDYWLFEANRERMRDGLSHLASFMATLENSPQRYFVKLPSTILPDQKLRVILSDDPYILGTLLSRAHELFSIRVGGRAGQANTPVYNTQCFTKFPFPDANNIQKQTIRLIAEELDAHRKRVLAEHPHLTLTGLYNVLEKLRAGTKPNELDQSDRTIFDHGLVLIIKELHDRLDVAVADAYGWPADLGDDDILSRLVALNKERAEEEKRGLVRWLRPDYQIPRFGKTLDKQAAREEGAQVAAMLDVTEKVQLPSFPAGAVEQTAAVFAVLAGSNAPIDAKSIAAQFRRTKTTEKKIDDVLASLARLGHVVSHDGKTFALRRAA